MPLGIGVPELLIILVVVLVIFGPKRLPGLGKQLGTGMREFKDSISGKDDERGDEPVRPTLDRAPEHDDAGRAFAQRDESSERQTTPRD